MKAANIPAINTGASLICLLHQLYFLRKLFNLLRNYKPFKNEILSVHKEAHMLACAHTCMLQMSVNISIYR